MGLKRGAPAPALIVPDEETWIVSGAGLDGAGLTPTSAAWRARVFVVPDRVPDGLARAVRAQWSSMSEATVLRVYASTLHGSPAEAVLHGGPPPSAPAHDEHGEHGGHGHDEHDDHGGHDHGDMMAIVGDPSTDGLVMEDLELEAGPLGTSLPGGLVIAAHLDGDVVAACEVRQTLRSVDPDDPPDPWSAAAWGVAEAVSRERAAGAVAPPDERWRRLAAVEVERTVGHLAWLHGFCRLLSWPTATAEVRALLEAVVPLRAALPSERAASTARAATGARLLEVAAAADGLCERFGASRMLAQRTAGVAPLTPDEVARRGLRGPVARAAGRADDARAGDAGYRAIGFAPVVRTEGDARARTLVRVAEAAQSARLAAAALDRARDRAAAADAPAFGTMRPGVVEGARGPLEAIAEGSGAAVRASPAERPSLLAAGELAVGREWASALVAVASFDLSPWAIGP